MRATILIVCFYLLHFVAWGQQPTGNPFNVTYRKPVVREIEKVEPVVQPEIVPVDTLPSTVIDTGKAPDFFNAQSDPDTTVKSETDGSGNPFDRKVKSNEKSEKTLSKSDSTSTKVTPAPLKDLKKPSKGIQVFFLLLSILLLIFIVNVEQGYFRDHWKVIANENYSALQQRNQRSTMRQIINVLGYLIFILQASIFLYHTQNILDIYSPFINTIWSCLFLVATIYIARHLVLRYVKWLFNRERQLMLFGFDITTFNTMVGIVLIPITSLLLFGPESFQKPLVIIGIILIAGAYLLRQLRWLVASRNWIVNSLLLFFVYLCAVEILPLWAISVIFW